jgi:hypothetical protein
MSALLISTCPGPPACTAVHTYLFVDGLDLVARSDSRVASLHPRPADHLSRPQLPHPAVGSGGRRIDEALVHPMKSTGSYTSGSEMPQMANRNNCPRRCASL